MSNSIRMVVREYGWVHLSLGLLGNFFFFVGSLLFLPPFEPYKQIGIWLFVVGSFLMFVGAFGRMLVDIWDRNGAASGKSVRPQEDGNVSTSDGGRRITAQ